MLSVNSKKTISFLIVGIMMFAVMAAAGCGEEQTADPGTNNQPEAAENADDLSGTLTIAGSTSVQPFSEVLGEAFMALHPNVQINVQGGGSSQGVTAAISGVADIGAASRAVKDEEMAECPELVITQFAIDGVVAVVHPSNEVSDLTKEQVKNIYLGNITNWNKVGGKDAPITVVSREDGSGTRDCFVHMALDKEEIVASAIIQNSNGAVRTTVAGDENAIGYVSMAMVNDEIKALDIDGAAASVENIRSGEYKISRPFNYVTLNAPEGLAKAYIDFVLSAEGQQIVLEEGAIDTN